MLVSFCVVRLLEDLTKWYCLAEVGKVRFRTISFAPTALVQNTYGEFPLQEWTLTPKDSQSSILTIKGISAEISIEIQGGKCRLVSPKLDAVKDVTDSHWVPPSYLFKVFYMLKR